MTAVFSFSARASFNESNELREYQVEVITFFLRFATKALRDNDGIRKRTAFGPRSRLLAHVGSAGARPKDRLQTVYVEAYDEYEAQEIAASMVADADYTMVQGVAWADTPVHNGGGYQKIAISLSSAIGGASADTKRV